MSDVFSEATGSGHRVFAATHLWPMQISPNAADAYELMPPQLRFLPKPTHSDQMDIRGARPCLSPAHWDPVPRSLRFC